MTARGIIAFLCLVLPVGASAQTVNPRQVEFDPSPDHSTVAGGVAVVSGYSLEVYASGASSPFYSLSMAKPAPDGDGKIRYDFSSSVSAWPMPGGTYEARVVANGPSGTGRSDASNAFAFGSCTPALSSSTASVGAGSGSVSLTLSVAAGCQWSATTSDTWISLGTASGSGTSTLSISFQSNTLPALRTATVRVGGQAFVLTQAAAACVVTVSPSTLSVVARATTATLSVTAGVGCAWTVSSQASWLRPVTLSGTGPGSITLNVDANLSVSSRSGNVTVAGSTLVIQQPGSTAPSAPANLRILAP